MTGNRCASLRCSTLAASFHWVTTSTALMWWAPLAPSTSPWCTESMRM